MLAIMTMTIDASDPLLHKEREVNLGQYSYTQLQGMNAIPVSVMSMRPLSTERTATSESWALITTAFGSILVKGKAARALRVVSILAQHWRAKFLVEGIVILGFTCIGQRNYRYFFSLVTVYLAISVGLIGGVVGMMVYVEVVWKRVYLGIEII